MDVGERLETTGPGRHRGERKKEVTFASAAEKKEADNSFELSALVAGGGLDHLIFSIVYQQVALVLS